MLNLSEREIPPYSSKVGVIPENYYLKDFKGSQYGMTLILGELKEDERKED